jgi:hypothetical protein
MANREREAFVAVDPVELRQILEAKIASMQKRDARFGDLDAKKSYQVMTSVHTYVRQLVEENDIQPVHGSGLEHSELRLVEFPEVTKHLTSYECVQIATLKPASSEEAVTLIPELGRFMPDDLDQLLSQM